MKQHGRLYLRWSRWDSVSDFRSVDNRCVFSDRKGFAVNIELFAIFVLSVLSAVHCWRLANHGK